MELAPVLPPPHLGALPHPDHWVLSVWLLPPGAHVQPRQELATLSNSRSGLTLSLLSPREGTLRDLALRPGEALPRVSTSPAQPLARIHFCPHSVVFRGVCAVCGRDVEHRHFADPSASPRLRVAYNHALSVSRAEAHHRASAAALTLLHTRRLSLVLDLDHTLVHATDDPRAASILRHTPPTLSNSSVHVFALTPLSRPMYLKLRPHLSAFLSTLSRLFQLHIYTMGSRLYADKIASIIDPQKNLFHGRVTSRDDFSEGKLNQKSISRLFPCDDSMALVVDDREDVWIAATQQPYMPNLIRAAPYSFWDGLRQVYDPNAPAHSFLPPPHSPLPSSAHQPILDPTLSKSQSPPSEPTPSEQLNSSLQRRRGPRRRLHQKLNPHTPNISSVDSNSIPGFTKLPSTLNKPPIPPAQSRQNSSLPHLPPPNSQNTSSRLENSSHTENDQSKSSHQVKVADCPKSCSAQPEEPSLPLSNGTASGGHLANPLHHIHHADDNGPHQPNGGNGQSDENHNRHCSSTAVSGNGNGHVKCSQTADGVGQSQSPQLKSNGKHTTAPNGNGSNNHSNGSRAESQSCVTPTSEHASVGKERNKVPENGEKTDAHMEEALSSELQNMVDDWWRKDSSSDGSRHLLRLAEILGEVHRRFFSHCPDVYDKENSSNGSASQNGEAPDVQDFKPPADVKTILDDMRSEVLRGCTITFTGVVPLGLEGSAVPIWNLAERMGAVCLMDFVMGETTHVVAAGDGRMNTQKCEDALSSGCTFVVTTRWLEDSAINFRRQDEFLYRICLNEELTNVSPEEYKRQIETNFDSRTQEKKKRRLNNGETASPEDSSDQAQTFCPGEGVHVLTRDELEAALDSELEED